MYDRSKNISTKQNFEQKLDQLNKNRLKPVIYMHRLKVENSFTDGSAWSEKLVYAVIVTFAQVKTLS